MGDLVPVDWWQRIAPSQYDPDGGTRYRNCDLCFQDCVTDVCAGKPEEHWRKFYRSQREGLNVCEHCVSRYLNEKPELTTQGGAV